MIKVVQNLNMTVLPLIIQAKIAVLKSLCNSLAKFFFIEEGTM